METYKGFKISVQEAERFDELGFTVMGAPGQIVYCARGAWGVVFNVKLPDAVKMAREKIDEITGS